MRIRTIQLEDGAESLFRVNVDGRYLVNGEWHDFEVLKHDSLVIRIEMTPPEVGSNEPLYFEDKLHFILENGAKQTVLLSGGAVDAYIQKEGMIIEENTTLLTDKAYVIYDSLVVKKGATLTLTEGTRLMFHDKAALHVYGKLLVQGSMEKPVVLRVTGWTTCSTISFTTTLPADGKASSSIVTAMETSSSNATCTARSSASSLRTQSK